jgi:ATP-dependent helicase/nuclease subunit B
MGFNDRCLAHLDAGGLILTADLRQARILRRLHDQAQIAAGRAAWPTAQVLPLSAWLDNAWRSTGAERPSLPVALAPAAMNWIWRQRVAADAPGLIDPADIGTRARASWLMLRAHGGDVAGLTRWPLTRDQQAFAGWSRAVENELADRGACDAADLVRCIVAEQALPSPAAPMLLVGFRNPAPAEAALFDALARRGWEVERASHPGREGSGARFAAADPDAERATMIAWLQERLAERPDGVHGIIVADLDQRRGGLERALEAALQPDLELAGAPRERVFDLAGGPPLLARAVVEVAFEALRYAGGGADWTAATRLLRSAYIAGSGEEREVRAQIDLRLRRDGRVHPADPIALAREARQGGAPVLATLLESAATASTGPVRRDAAAWAESFGRCLAAWGWPGAQESLESSDWQAARRFGELLREFAGLSAVAGPLTGDRALAQLHDLAGAPFQPEGGEPAVFVLDRWEDPGLAFDSLWVSGLTSAVWPRPVRVDPFLPIDAQRRLGMPLATAQGCIHEAEAIVAAWQAQTPALVLSWPTRVDDTDVEGSPLIPAGLAGLVAPRRRLSRAALQLEAATLEATGDDPAPALTAIRSAGGARVLELQAACPFRAFGELRLGAAPLEEPQAGIDRRVRGIVLHRALERFWSGLGTQAALLALDREACEQRIADSVERALSDALPAEVGAKARTLEREWQCRAVGGLLAIERSRAPFTVAETERELKGRIGGLEFRLRVDRVDAVDGSRVVIDYKTGRTGSGAWRGARMDAPQLPLYAVLHPDRPGAIAIAEANGAGARFVGVGEESIALEGLTPARKFALTEDREQGFEWPAITQHWWAWLDALARDFAAGRAAVDPKLAAATCRRCHLGGLCRVDAARVRDDVPEEASDDA